MTQKEIKEIAHSLGKAQTSGSGYTCLCPAHDDHNPSLSISVGENEKLLLRCHAGCSFEEILKKLEERGLLRYRRHSNTECAKTQSKRGVEAVPLAVSLPKKGTESQLDSSFYDQNHEDEDPTNKEKALKLWDAASEIEGTLADTYLRKRGIDTTSLKGQLSDSLRFHPSVYHRFFREEYSCLIAKVTNKDGSFMAIHRIFLTPEGDKIPKDKDGKSQAKLSLGNVKGGAVYLTPPQEQIIVTEGVEDALTLVQCCPGYGVLAFLGGNIAFDLPHSVQEIIIAADNDEPGQKLARRIRRRLQGEGKAVGLVYPPEGKDFNEFFLKKNDASAIQSLMENAPLEISGTISQKTDADIIFKYQTREPQFLIEGLLPDVGVAILGGHPKIGKSWMAQGWVTDIIFNKKILANLSTKPVGILYYGLEDNASRLKSRFQKILGKSQPFFGGLLSFQTLCQPLDRGGLESLRKDLESSPHIKLVVIDPYEKIRPQEQKNNSGNAYQNDYKGIGLLKDLAEEFEILILLIHHLRKNTTGNPVSDFNGSMGLTGSTDTILTLNKKEDDYTLKVTGKDVEEQIFSLDFDSESCRFSISEKQHKEETGLQKQILDFLRRAAKPCSPKEIATNLGKKSNNDQSSIRKQLGALLEKKKVTKPQKGLYEILGPNHEAVPSSDNDTAKGTGPNSEFIRPHNHSCTPVPSLPPTTQFNEIIDPSQKIGYEKGKI